MTTALELADHRRELREQGFTIIPHALTPDQLASARETLVERARFEESDASGWVNGGNQRVFGLVNKGQIFRDVAEHPLALAMMKDMLVDPDRCGATMLAEHLEGIEFLLFSLTANIALPGCPLGVMHQDQTAVASPWPRTFVGNVIWMLDDFTEENGATRFVPGTQDLREVRCWPDSDEDYGDPVPVIGKAGSAFVFNGRILHQSGANRSAEKRHALLAAYCVPYLRSQENYSRMIDAGEVPNLSPNLRRLLGFETYFEFGNVDGFAKDVRLTMEDAET